MKQRIENVVILASQVFSCAGHDIKITYFGSGKWIIESDIGIFRLNGKPYFADSIEELERALIDFKNGLQSP